jgi:hypothetical protein
MNQSKGDNYPFSKDMLVSSIHEFIIILKRTLILP